MSEELALDEALRDGRAVDLDEGAVGARAARWISRATSSLPGAVLPEDEDA